MYSQLNQVHATVCVSASSNFGCKNYLFAVHFSCVFGSFCHIIRYIENLKTGIQKRPCQSLEKTSLSIVIYSFTPAYGSTAQELATKIHQK